MKTLATAAVITLVVALISEPASAQPRKKRGTHFLAELHTGVSFPLGDEAIGAAFAMNATFGFGGRPRGWPMRFYLIGNIGWARYSARKVGAPEARYLRDTMEYSAGLRFLLPLVARLRVFADFTLGGMTEFSEADLYGVQSFRGRNTVFAMYPGFGLQYRLFRFLSLGASCNFAIVPRGSAYDPIAEIAGFTRTSRTRVNVLATITFHF